DEMIAAGVDGIDIRDEGHSTMTDYPEEYGFNEVVLERARARGGVLGEAIAAVRGEAYTSFLRECRARTAGAGIRLRYHLQLDFLRPDPVPVRRLAYPANIDFAWRQWIDEGLMDEAVLRYYSLPFSALFDDPIALEMTARCRSRGIPVT